MNHLTKLIIIILLMTTLGYCKKKEESKPIEESSATIETEPAQDEQIGRAHVRSEGRFGWR